VVSIPRRLAADFRLDRREAAGAVADVGVLVPLAVALIVGNGLSATAVLLPAGLLYLAAAFVYRLPVPVQPLKAFAAIAIAKHVGSDEIAAGALVFGVLFIILGRSGVLDVAARAFPRALIRGVQLTVGLLFLKIAWGLVTKPPRDFEVHALAPAWAIPAGLSALLLLLAFRRLPVTLVLVAGGAAAAGIVAHDGLSLGPSGLSLPSLSPHTLWAALTVLVIPQLALSFANSCLATADAARVYFGERARLVTPGRLATSFGTATAFAGAISGMPVCHGAGGLTAHYQFGARRAAAPALMGSVLIVLALLFGADLAAVLAAFPLPILAGLLATAGLLHIALVRDLRGAHEWALALFVGVLGFETNLTLSLGLGLGLWWLGRGGLYLRHALQPSG
jgi:SulP family sulfate permease